MINQRPSWTFTEMSEADFRKIRDHRLIVSVKSGCGLRAADCWVEWLSVENKQGEVLQLPEGWQLVLNFVGKSASPGLFDFTHLGRRMLALIIDIDGWERQNKADRAEYERLKAKFGDT